MLQATGFDHINMNVKDINETTQFYVNHFGFKVLEEGKSSSGLDFKIIGIPSKLSLAIYPSDNILNQDKQNINHIGIHLDNFSEALKYLDTHNIPYEYGGYVEYDNSRSIYIVDPNGYEIELSEKFSGNLS